ncbi:uncharacterized protein LOC124367580 [Homalodisca vitripennis]|uniref:uncharacterized protein LOC124367580 n=1 Tax=Homalodisca vitripennis TaxID=197043 RepID=UPI001EEA209A|nr:uncharacterized protein LOC124367580 [Homalodisca vitripennis]XP_046680487.1 uncharacterized protein LOC124367580 [Homalodisca vitripennis]XP_046680488.1 uncharacterized protein LOC124367580 [Homalodisca vitripennis]KAG8293806.1 hypothetical protein J6590_010797 [Homalodisca vitripennis]
MKTCFVFVVAFLVTLEVVCGVRFGGEKPTNPSDIENVKQAKKMLKKSLEEEVIPQPGYTTKIILKDVKVKKQIVNGIRYNVQATVVYKTKCITDPALCKPQATKITKCKASFWVPFEINGKLQYTEDGLPQCDA